VNARSLVPHFPSVIDLLRAFEFDILAISESWLRATDDTSMFNIDNYSLVRQDRSSGARGGGVVLYVSNALPFSPIDFAVSPASVSTDMVGVTIFLRSVRIAVFSVYRPPRAPLSDLSFLESRLTYAACCTDAIICMGDLNIDMLCGSSPGVSRLNDIMSLLSLRQIVNSPTRITCNTSTLLDLILISSSIGIAESGVDDLAHISDHLTVFAHLTLAKPRRLPRTSLKRDLYNIPDELLLRDLAAVNWSLIHDAVDINEMVRIFTSSIMSIFDRLAPLTIRRCNRPHALDHPSCAQIN